MWNLIKNDPILKTISILILGIFAFSFAFSIMFGAGGQTGMEHDAAAGYSAATGLGQIIVLLSKVFIIVLLVAIIIVAVKFVKKHIVGNEPIKGMEQFKNKPIISALVGIGGILLLLLAINLLTPTASTSEMVHTTTSATNYGFGLGITGFLTILLRLVAVISLIGLIIGLVMYFRDRYSIQLKLSAAFRKETCSECGVELKPHWKCCPSCGTEKSNDELVEVMAEENEKN